MEEVKRRWLVCTGKETRNRPSSFSDCLEGRIEDPDSKVWWESQFALFGQSGSGGEDKGSTHMPAAMELESHRHLRPALYNLETLPRAKSGEEDGKRRTVARFVGILYICSGWRRRRSGIQMLVATI